MAEKLAFEMSNPIDWENKKCVICTFSLDTDIRSIQTSRDEITDIDFITRKENKILRNICSKEPENTSNLLTMKQYYKVFKEVFILRNGKYKHRKKGKWEGLENKLAEDVCKEDYAEYENLQDLFSAIYRI